MRGARFLLLLFLVATPVSSFAQIIELPGSYISLQQIIASAIRYNPVIEEIRTQWMISERGYLAAWGDFEPELVARYESADLNQQNSAQEVVSQFGQTEYSDKTEEYGVGIEGTMLSGGSFWIGYTLEHSASSLSDEDEYTSFAGATVEQPLLKGAMYGTPLAQLRIAKRERSISYEEYRKSLMEVVSQVESAYWNLAFAQELHLLATDSLSIAKKLLGDTEAQVRAGRLTSIDLLEAQAGLSLRETYLLDTEQQIWDARSELRILLADAPGLSYDELVTGDPLLPEEAERKSIEELTEWALIAQPDYLVRKHESDLERLALDYRKGQVLPELNIKGSFGLNGKGPSVAESLAKVNEQEYPTWSISAELRIPVALGIRERNELAVAEYRKKIADDKVDSAKFEIERSLEVLKRRIQTLERQINDARSVTELKEQQLEIQQTLLKAGKTTSRAIYQVEDDLSQSRQREIELILRVREAVMQLNFIAGTVLRDFGLETRVGDEVFLMEWFSGLRKP